MLKPLVQAIELWFNTLIVEQVLPFIGMAIEYVVVGLLITPLFLINQVTDAIDIFAGVKPIYGVDSLDAAKIEAAYDSSPHFLLWKEEYESTPPYPRTWGSANLSGSMAEGTYNSYTAPVKDIWRGHIQKNESIVMRASKKNNDYDRYMPYIREFLRENNIKPDSEEMYRALSNALTTGVQVGMGIKAGEIPAPPQIDPVSAYKSVMMPGSLIIPYFEYTDPKADNALYLILEAYSKEGLYAPEFEMKSNGEKMSRSEKKKFKDLNKKNLPVYEEVFKKTVEAGMAYPQYLNQRLSYLRDNPSVGNNIELDELYNAVYAHRSEIGEFMDESDFSYVNSEAATEKSYVETWNKKFPGMELNKKSPEWQKTLPFFYYWPSTGVIPVHWPPLESLIMPMDEWFNEPEQAEIRNEYASYEARRYAEWYRYYYETGLSTYIARVGGDYTIIHAMADAAVFAAVNARVSAKRDADEWLTSMYDVYKVQLENDRKNMPSWANQYNFFMSYSSSMMDEDLLYGDFTGNANGRANITIACFFPANELWVDYIQNNAGIVADWTREYYDSSRYTKEIRDIITGLRLTPGSDAFYKAVSAKILNYELDVGNMPVNKWLPASLGYTPYAGNTDDIVTTEYQDTGLRGTLLDYFITNPAVNTVFWGVTVISLALAIGFSIYAVVRSMGDLKVNKPVGKVLGLVGKTMLTFLIIPFFVLVAINLASIVLKQTTYAFHTRSGSENVTISGALFSASLVPEAVLLPGEKPLFESFTVNADRQIVIKENYRSSDTEARQRQYERMVEKYNGERIGYTHIPEMRRDFELALLLYPGSLILVSLCAWVFVVFLILIIFIFIRRVFDIVLLYIISPLYTATIPLDEGMVFKRWREKFIGACISGFGSLITFQLFLLLIPLIWERGFNLTDNFFTDNVMKTLLTLGGIYAVYKSHTLVTSLVSQEAANADSATMAATVGAIGTAAAAVKMVGEMVVKEVTGIDTSNLTGGDKDGGIDGGNKDGGKDGKDDKDKDKEGKDGKDSGSGNKNPAMGGDKAESSKGAGGSKKDDSSGAGKKDDSGVSKTGGDNDDKKHKVPEKEPPKPPSTNSDSNMNTNIGSVPVNTDESGSDDGGSDDGGGDDGNEEE